MKRIANKFNELKKRRKKAFIAFITAGYPSLEATRKLVLAFEKDGVDLVELGVPFSDPLADGPVIQESSRRALLKGTDLKGILRTVRQIRRDSGIPILLMSYLNPILSYGVGAFAKDSVSAGVDGVIVPDLPPDEGAEISSVFRRAGLDHVYLLAPTSTPQRMQKIVRAASGFIYYVSMTGTTGMKNKLSSSLGSAVRQAKRLTRTPICVGFGISTPQDASQAARTADGVIVGSALVKPLLGQPSVNAAAFSRRVVRPFAKALGTA